MRTRYFAHFVLQLLPFFAAAQDPITVMQNDYQDPFVPHLFESPADSAAFMQFRAGLEMLPSTGTPDTVRHQLHMVWRVQLRGGLWSVRRGDGSELQDVPFNANADTWYGRLPFRAADGRCGLMLFHEFPCALLCRSVQYYVEEVP